MMTSAMASTTLKMELSDDYWGTEQMALFDDTDAASPGGGSTTSSSSAEETVDLLLGQVDLDLTSDMFANFDLDNVLKVEEPFAFLDGVDVVQQQQTQQQEMQQVDETIKSDCMWSSSLNFLDDIRKKNRNRDHSLTLSECADSLFRDIKDIDCVLGANSGNGNLAELIEESDIEVSDEEIDVVSDCDASSSSSSTISSYSTGSYSSHSHHHNQQQQQQYRHTSASVPAGRSLLRNSRNLHQQQQQQQTQQVRQQQFQAQPSPQTIIDHMNGDHCYFALRQEPSSACGGNNGSSLVPSSPQGLLTPNESSDDEDNIMTHSRRILNHPVKQEQQPQSDQQHVKFKFRMKFKSDSPQRSLLNINNNGGNSSTARHHAKRKSAIRNPHCPTPSPAKMPRMERNFEDSEESEEEDPLRLDDGKKSSRKSSSVGSPGGGGNNQDQKCREIRDLHNSMERQRRVDLRNNFDQLKDVVPELRDVEKASKLNILNKSAEYCRQLHSLDSRLGREKEREINRRAVLKKRLAQLLAGNGNNSSHHHHQPRMSSYSSRAVSIHSSGSSRHYY